MTRAHEKARDVTSAAGLGFSFPVKETEMNASSMSQPGAAATPTPSTRKLNRADKADAAIFWKWLMRQTEREDIVGDFAREAKSDRGATCCKPAFCSADGIEAHLSGSHSACGNAVLAGRQAWAEFRSDLDAQVTEALAKYDATRRARVERETIRVVKAALATRGIK